MTRPLIAACVTALALLAVAAPASAETVKISYSDLNLATVQGQQALETRIDRAAKKVCDYDRIATGTRFRSSAAVQCYEQAKLSAARQMAVAVSDARLGG